MKLLSYCYRELSAQSNTTQHSYTLAAKTAIAKTILTKIINQMISHKSETSGSFRVNKDMGILKDYKSIFFTQFLCYYPSKRVVS